MVQAGRVPEGGVLEVVWPFPAPGVAIQEDGPLGHDSLPACPTLATREACSATGNLAPKPGAQRNPGLYLSPSQAIVYEGQDKNPEMCRVLLTHEIMCR